MTWEPKIGDRAKIADVTAEEAKRRFDEHDSAYTWYREMRDDLGKEGKVIEKCFGCFCVDVANDGEEDGYYWPASLLSPVSEPSADPAVHLAAMKDAAQKARALADALDVLVRATGGEG